jgi:hypothetical protein
MHNPSLLLLAAASFTGASAGAQTARSGAGAAAAPAPALPAAGTAVTRAAEVDSPSPRDRRCAQRVRVPGTGREYLLRRAVTEERTTRAGDTTTVTYASAVARYEALGLPATGGPGAPSIWVDCQASRVVAMPAGQ